MRSVISFGKILYIHPPEEPSQEGWEVTREVVEMEVAASGVQDDDALEEEFDLFLASKYGRSPTRVKEAWERTALRDNRSYHDVQAPDLFEFINERRASRGEEPLVLPQRMPS